MFDISSSRDGVWRLVDGLQIELKMVDKVDFLEHY